MILKIKVLIYKLTGKYLAEKEEIKYLQSNEFLIDFHRMYNHPNNTFGEHTIRSALIGSWQAKNGFHKKYWMKYVFMFLLVSSLNNIAVKDCLDKNFHKCEMTADQFQCKVNNMIQCMKLEKK